MNILEELQWRGLLADCTDLDALSERIAQGPITLYCGFDPTGDSLHVGHLMGQLTLRRFQMAGHHPIALAGGATGMVGDPSGRSAERNLLTREQLSHNIASIKKQLARLLDFDATENPARLTDNADWIAPISFLDFLRDVGKHFPINIMLAKDSVKSRLGSEAGISYTEFSYQLLQAYDFLHLHRAHGCDLQIGGSDQWGNLVAGTDLIRRKMGPETTTFGWTFPLITKSDGTKFGKTADGAVWLDPAKTSPYRFYQFFINTEDAKVCEYLRKFTFLSKVEIEALEAAHAENPGRRTAHQALAAAVTTIVHGAEACADVQKASSVMFGGGIQGISESAFADVVGEVPNIDATTEQFNGEGTGLIDLVVQTGLCPSKGQARKDIAAGGIYVNNERSNDIARHLTTDDLLFDKYLLLRKGKRNYAVIRVKG
jgi:tyrosyl-tRNA synthetase